MAMLQSKKLIGTLVVLLCSTFMVHAKTVIPVFLLSGQSNMTGYAASADLTADQKKNIDNVKIYMDLTWEGNASKVKKWLTLGINFGSGNANQGQSIGPELFFGRTLSEAMPNTKIALIKVCCGSTYLGYYTADNKIVDCWVPPSSHNGQAGRHYKRMMDTAIVAAMKTFSTAYDTAQYTPKWAGFVWLQGEFDGQVDSLAKAYEKNLTYLIEDIRKDLKVTDLPAIIPMIDVQNSWRYNSTIRAAEVAVTKTMKNVDTLDTKGYSTDNTHYKAQGQVKIGTVSAQRWLDMKFAYDPAVAIENNYTTPHVVHLAPLQNAQHIIYDLSGRKIAVSQAASDKYIRQPGVYIENIVAPGASHGRVQLSISK